MYTEWWSGAVDFLPLQRDKKWRECGFATLALHGGCFPPKVNANLVLINSTKHTSLPIYNPALYTHGCDRIRSFAYSHLLPTAELLRLAAPNPGHIRQLEELAANQGWIVAWVRVHISIVQSLLTIQSSCRNQVRRKTRPGGHTMRQSCFVRRAYWDICKMAINLILLRCLLSEWREGVHRIRKGKDARKG